jgi:xanthine/uracil permease
MNGSLHMVVRKTKNTFPPLVMIIIVTLISCSRTPVYNHVFVPKAWRYDDRIEALKLILTMVNNMSRKEE